VKRLALIFTFAVLASLLVLPSAFAANTGRGVSVSDLNNIPVTDTLAAGTMEWDVTGRYNGDFPRGRRIGTRLFTALFDNFEFGMAWGVSRPAGPVELAMKYKVLDEFGGWPVSLAIGADRITGNYQRTNVDPMYYAVIGLHDVRIIGWSDWYLGYANNPVGFDNEDNSIFGGFKYWFNDKWQLNADYLGYDTNHENVMSAGLNYNWVKHLGFQGWVERDSVEDKNIFVLQLNVKGDLRDLTAEVSDPE